MWWHDRAGRFSRTKALCLAVCCAPAILLGAQWATGATGPRSLNFLNHACGDWALRFILASLAVTPFREIFRAPRLFIIRRMLGLAGFCYLVAHVAFYIALQNGRLGFVASEIIKHSYMTIGLVAWLVFASLAATSTDAMIARMGVWWRRQHALIYAAAAAGALHFMMQGKITSPHATLQMGILLWLLAWRLCPRAWRGKSWFLAGYAVAIGLATAGLEGLWFALTTHANVPRILMANLRWGYAPRPAVWVLMLGMAVVVAMMVRERRNFFFEKKKQKTFVN